MFGFLPGLSILPVSSRLFIYLSLLHVSLRSHRIRAFTILTMSSNIRDDQGAVSASIFPKDWNWQPPSTYQKIVTIDAVSWYVGAYRSLFEKYSKGYQKSFNILGKCLPAYLAYWQRASPHSHLRTPTSMAPMSSKSVATSKSTTTTSGGPPPRTLRSR